MTNACAPTVQRQNSKFFFSCPFVFWSAEQDFEKRNRVTTPANDTEALA
jgi:hypothetical protein